MTGMKHRMLRGELHLADDPELLADHAHAQRLLERYNATRADQQHDRDALLRDLLGGVGPGVVVRPTFRCEYGAQVVLGPGTRVDADCHFVDVAPIRTGVDCRIAAGVRLVAGTYPVDPYARRQGWRYGKPITLGDNVLIGVGAVICPGVTIGSDTVVGAGAVVTRDLPPLVVATGNPARPRRHIDALDAVSIPSVWA
jgi:maltose O-acetyltransferase